MAIVPKSSYYDQHYRQTAALMRARRPYLIKNMLTGGVIFGFAIGVYAFTINAISQDDFDDVQVPDAPPQTPHAPHTGTNTAARSPTGK